MNLTVNGQQYSASSHQTLESLLEEMGFLGKRIAVELNGRVIPKSTYSDTPVNEGDTLEVIKAIGGG